MLLLLLSKWCFCALRGGEVYAGSHVRLFDKDCWMDVLIHNKFRSPFDIDALLGAEFIS